MGSACLALHVAGIHRVAPSACCSLEFTAFQAQQTAMEQLKLKMMSTSSKPALQSKQVKMPPRPHWDPIASLSKIARVQINDAQVRGGVVFYKVGVFLKRQANRIPTNVRSVSDPDRKPDYVVLRRFSDFDLLRQHTAQHARKEIVGACSYCDRFRLFMLHCYKQPKAFVKLCTGVEARKKVLERFLNRMIELAVADERGATRVCQCPGVRAIPILLDQFMRNRYVV